MNGKIYELLENMDEELEDAEKYVEKAIECGRAHSPHKSVYISLAEDELKHYERLESILKSHEIPEDMKWYLEKKHAHLIKEHANIKYMIAKANE